MIKCGIIGGAGYTAGELIRLLLNHPWRSLWRDGFGVHQRVAVR